MGLLFGAVLFWHATFVRGLPRCHDPTKIDNGDRVDARACGRMVSSGHNFGTTTTKPGKLGRIGERRVHPRVGGHARDLAAQFDQRVSGDESSANAKNLSEIHVSTISSGNGNA